MQLTTQQVETLMKAVLSLGSNTRDDAEWGRCNELYDALRDEITAPDYPEITQLSEPQLLTTVSLDAAMWDKLQPMAETMGLTARDHMLKYVNTFFQHPNLVRIGTIAFSDGSEQYEHQDNLSQKALDTHVGSL